MLSTTGKSIAIFATLFGCFAIFYPDALSSRLSLLFGRNADAKIYSQKLKIVDSETYGTYNCASKRGRKNVALITSVTGQDGPYLAEFLMNKGYEVHGIIRQASTSGTQRLEDYYKSILQHYKGASLTLHYGDMTDSFCLVKVLNDVRPSEIYNLAALTDVKVSFDMSEYTANVNALGTLRVLEAIRSAGLGSEVRFFQASTGGIYGKVQEVPQRETTPFYPQSPYGVSKLYSYWITRNYREAYGLFACSGIMFNHASSRLAETFVSRKITRAVARIAYRQQEVLELGNLDARRDWGHAKDYIEAMWLMLQRDNAEDYVLSTGVSHSVRQFVETAFKYVGIDVVWEGFGENEVGKDKSTGHVRVRVNAKYYRPTEVDIAVGDATKAWNELGWKPKFDFQAIVSEMMGTDLQLMNTNSTA